MLEGFSGGPLKSAWTMPDMGGGGITKVIDSYAEGSLQTFKGGIG